MRRKLLMLVTSLVLAITLIFTASACAKPKISVSFVQNGQETIVREIVVGGSLKAEDIPTPVTKTGYDVVWDVVDFTNIQEDLTVNVVETAKTYVLMFNVNGGDELPNGSATYDSPVDLPEATREGYDFLGWYLGNDLIEDGSVWRVADNVSLRAEWELAPWNPEVDYTLIEDEYDVVVDFNGGNAVSPNDWELVDINLNSAPASNFSYKVRVTLSDTFGADEALYGVSKAYVRFFGATSAWSGETNIEAGNLGVCFNIEPGEVSMINFAGGSIIRSYENLTDLEMLASGNSFILEVGSYEIDETTSALFIVMDDVLVAFAEYTTGEYCFGQYISFGSSTPKFTYEDLTEKLPEPVIDYTNLTVYDIMTDFNSSSNVETGSWSINNINIGTAPTNNFAYKMQVNYYGRFGGDPALWGTSAQYLKFFGATAGAWNTTDDSNIEAGESGVCLTITPQTISVIDYVGGTAVERYSAKSGLTAIIGDSSIVLEVGGYEVDSEISAIYVKVNDAVVAYAEYVTGSYTFGNYISIGSGNGAEIYSPVAE